MNIERNTYLYRQYQAGVLTESEREEWKSLLVNPSFSSELSAITDSDWDALSEDTLLKMNAGRSAEMRSGIMNQPQERLPSRKLWPRAVIAAAVATVLVATSIWFIANKDTSSKPTEIVYKNDIAPGKIGATLTLASGKKISLDAASSGEIVKEAGISISKTADGQVVYHVQSAKGKSNDLHTLATAIGETYMLTLPDQTKVWLNAASSLTYNPVLTTNGVRRVKLTGEGYFEVTKDKAHPFLVESGTQEIEVLGTHFNVNAYEDEKAYRTTLLEGSVKIADHGHTEFLEPGIQASNLSGNIRLSKVDTEFAVAWKSNNFVFDRLDIKEIMRMISRWYNVEVIYKDEIPESTFWGSVSRFDNISKVLIPLEATGDVHFKIEGRKIYVLK